MPIYVRLKDNVPIARRTWSGLRNKTPWRIVVEPGTFGILFGEKGDITSMPWRSDSEANLHKLTYASAESSVPVDWIGYPSLGDLYPGKTDLLLQTHWLVERKSIEIDDEISVDFIEEDLVTKKIKEMGYAKH